MLSYPVAASNDSARNIKRRRGSAFKLDGMPYPIVNGEDVIDIPEKAIKGRINPTGKTFRGYISRDEIRIDCVEELSAWISISLADIPAFAAAPEGSVAREAKEEFESASAEASVESQVISRV